jgi:hypothetical protein
LARASARMSLKQNMLPSESAEELPPIGKATFANTSGEAARFMALPGGETAEQL